MNDENYGNVETEGEMTGTVKHWAATYGFITPDDPMLNDVFIYHAQIEPWREGHKSLTVGQKVKFGYVKSQKLDKHGKPRYEAVNLQVERVKASSKLFERTNGQQ